MLDRFMVHVQKTHVILWLSLVFYLIIQTLRSWYLVYDYPIQLIRWLVLFVLLIPLYFILKNESEKPYKNLPLFIVCCSVAYASVYLGQGLLCEFNHVSRFADQGNFVAGSSYAVLPFLLTIPAVMLLISSPSAKIKALVISCVVLMVSTSFYYDSRVLGYTLLGFMGLSWFVLPWRKALLFCLSCSITFIILVLYVSIMRSIDGTILSNSIMLFGNKIDLSYINAYINLYDDTLPKVLTGIAQSSDADRISHIIAPVNAITVNPITALFGYGTYQHHLVLQPFVQSVADSRDLHAIISSFVRTTGFGAFVADYGIIGSILLLGNVACSGLSLLLQHTKFSVVLFFVLAIGVGWLIISNILDNMLFWLLLVPFGILWKLGIDKQ